MNDKFGISGENKMSLQKIFKAAGEEWCLEYMSPLITKLIIAEQIMLLIRRYYLFQMACITRNALE